MFEKVTVPEGASWAMLNRRLDDGIPFQWHYHPEFELTLTLNSRGQRYIGDSIATYDDGDLVLLGPNLPHTWCSTERIDAARPHIAHRDVVHARAWGESVTTTLAEMRAGCADAGARRARHRVLARTRRRRHGRSSRRSRRAPRPTG